MKKKALVLSAVAALATTSFASAELEKRLSGMEAQIKKLENKLKQSNKKLNEVKAHGAADNIKWSVDFRTAVDKISYTTASGNKTGNDALLTNRLLLNMAYAPSENVFFKGRLGYNKAYGAAPTGDNTNGTNPNGMPQRGYGYDTFDWVVGENATDDKLRVREAYWLYKNDTFLGTDVSWTASFGRRPSTDGFLVNMRNDMPAQSPLGHNIDVEFDGASFKFGLENVTDVEGMSWKLCTGRGLSNATPRFDMSGGLASKGDYSVDDNALDTIDLMGFIFVPYDNGQYSVKTNMFVAKNLPGFVMANGTIAANQNGTTGNPMDDYFDVNSGNGMVGSLNGNWDSNGHFVGMSGKSMNTDVTMKTMGDLSGAAISFKADGIGEEINDFLDDTIFFASWAQSKTSPDNQQDMMNLAAFDDFKGSNATQIAFGMTAQTLDLDPNTPANIPTIVTEMNKAYGTTIDTTGATTMTDIAANPIAQDATMSETLSANMATAANKLPSVKSGMLGSTEEKTGHSIYMGVQIPCPISEDARIGVEYNKGSKYWRSFTYGEDTMAGSKLAARGSAWEVYYKKPLTKSLTLQARYTSIDYDYTGSQAFFGDDGMPMSMAEAQAFGMDPIDKATDLRVAISYRY
ncbi:MAG: DUF3373 family protein [Campylobacterota bacterium]|nr:DUF3373 family protein [Campylobacterota bacterium]